MKIIKLVSDEVVTKTTKNWFDKAIDKISGESVEWKMIEEVKFWYLEVDEEKKIAHREIGFNELNEPIIYFPNQKNPYGLWADSPVSFLIEQYDKIELNEFEKIWDKLNKENVA